MYNSNPAKPGVDVTTAEHPLDADIQEQASIFRAFVVTVEHFFGGKPLEVLSTLPPETHLVFRTSVQLDAQRSKTCWMNQIAYVDTKRKEHSVSVIECLETEPDADKQLKTTRFKWIANFNVTASKVVSLANQGGRLHSPEQDSQRSPLLDCDWAVALGVGKLKTKASTFKRMGDTHWNTSSARTPLLARSSICCCRLPICFPN